MSEMHAAYNVTYCDKAAVKRALKRASRALLSNITYLPPETSLVAALIQYSDWTQEQFAQRLGVNVSTLRRWSTPEEMQEHRTIPYSAWCLALLLTGFLTLDSLTG